MSEYTEFLERIKTYTFDKWTLRSSKISPYHLASWGFICVSEDTFECSMCQERISGAHLPFQSEAEEQGTIDVDLLIKNFFGKISSVHQQECLYNENNHTSSVFFTLNDDFLISNMQQLYTLVYDSYTSLDLQNDVQLDQKQLSSTTSSTPKYPLLDISFLKIIPQNYHFILSEDQKYVNIKSLDVRRSLSAFAWRYDEDAQSGERTLSCDFCGRTVQLKRFQTISSRYMKLGQQQQNNNEGFNPYEEHKYFCKWSSAQIQSIEAISISEDKEESTEKGSRQKAEKQNIQQINGWNICINYLLDQFTYQSKKKKTFETVSEIHKMQDEIKKLQTDFKSFESSISDKYATIVKECESINLTSLDSNSTFKHKLQQNRQSLDDILKDLNLSSLIADPTKKVKTN